MPGTPYTAYIFRLVFALLLGVTWDAAGLSAMFIGGGGFLVDMLAIRKNIRWKMCFAWECQCDCKTPYWWMANTRSVHRTR